MTTLQWRLLLFPLFFLGFVIPGTVLVTLAIAPWLGILDIKADPWWPLHFLSNLLEGKTLTSPAFEDVVAYVAGVLLAALALVHGVGVVDSMTTARNIP